MIDPQIVREEAYRKVSPHDVKLTHAISQITDSLYQMETEIVSSEGLDPKEINRICEAVIKAAYRLTEKINQFALAGGNKRILERSILGESINRLILEGKFDQAKRMASYDLDFYLSSCRMAAMGHKEGKIDSLKKLTTTPKSLKSL